MMKDEEVLATKSLWMLALVLCLCLGAASAAGAEADALARDITGQCLFNGRESITDLEDGNYRTFWTSHRQEGAHCLMVSAPEAVGGVLVRWRNPAPLAAQVKQDGEWITVAQSDAAYAALYLPLPGLTEFRLVNAESAWAKLEICEVTVYSQGTLPEDVQVWREPAGQVDLMLLSAHPDDEVLWFGGLLPYYAGERQKECLVVCFAYNAYHRRLELLDSLWTCGVRAYPVFAGYQDYLTSTLKDMYQYWDKQSLYQDVCNLYRQYRPQVVVAHDKHGEYGHGAHQAVSDAARKATKLAADETQCVGTVKTLGVWQVPKVYIHLWEENQLAMDWHQPLAAFDGLTAQEVARRAYACHTSQQQKQWAVLDGGIYDNSLFGLFSSTVGPDVEKNDLFEHLE